MRSLAIAATFIEQPYNIIITTINEEDPLAFTEEGLGQFPERDIDLSGPGMTAQITLATTSLSKPRDTSSSFVFGPRWTLMESSWSCNLFEGYLSLEVSFDWSLRFKRKGHGTSESHGLSLWAVRPKKDGNGKASLRLLGALFVVRLNHIFLACLQYIYTYTIISSLYAMTE